MAGGNRQDGLEAWYRLSHTPGLNRDAARILLAAFGSASAVIAAGPERCSQFVPGRAVGALFDVTPESQRWLAMAQTWLAGGPRRSWIALDDAQYPAALLNTADPPLMLYAVGDVALLSRPALAIVGSRNTTPAGLQNARSFAKDLAARGWVIVSGLARGIDAAAHEGALAAGGATLAVVGTGLDQVYPPENAELAHRMADQGLVISEFPPGSPPKSAHFPQRNRIISGLARGVLVVEAALRSGSLITARLAAEAGREVFAIPGSIQAPQAKGCHALIKQGAKLVESYEDILEELGGSPVPGPTGLAVPAKVRPAERAVAPAPTRSPDQQALLEAMGFDVQTLDALCARLGWPIADLSARLLECELLGDVVRLPGGMYQRIGQA